MVPGVEFIRLSRRYFSFLQTEFGYKELTVKHRRNLFYDIEYRKENIIISLSYENTEDYLQIILFSLSNGLVPDYDDKQATIHLGDLNNKILPFYGREDFVENERFFSSVRTKTKIEKDLLKLAKELRLCLKHKGFSETL
jgi:hypothetical protein